MRKVFAMAALVAASAATPAMATDYTFVFTNQYQPYETISGTIEGLTADGTQQHATHIFVTGLPNQLAPIDVVATWAQYYNSFDVSGGVIDPSTSLVDFIGSDGSFFLGSPAVGNGTAARFDLTANGSYEYAATATLPTYQPLFTSAGPGGVPEPATWVMMLLGFGAIGYSVRRKSAAVLAAS